MTPLNGPAFLLFLIMDPSVRDVKAGAALAMAAVIPWESDPRASI